MGQGDAALAANVTEGRISGTRAGSERFAASSVPTFLQILVDKSRQQLRRWFRGHPNGRAGGRFSNTKGRDRGPNVIQSDLGYPSQSDWIRAAELPARLVA